MSAFEVSFSISKELKKVKVNGEIAFTLISMFHIQMQEPASRSTTVRTFVFLAKCIFAKYLKQEVDDDLSVCVDKRRDWRYNNLSMSRDQKVITLLPKMDKYPMDFYQVVVFTTQIWGFKDIFGDIFGDIK